MSLWTPGGEHPVDRGGSSDEQRPPAGEPPGAAETPLPPDLEDLSPEDRARVEEMAREMQQVREQIAAAPAADVVANHAMGIYELAAIHLTSEPPRLAEAQLAIDALSALVDGLAGRLGEAEKTLIEARSQLQMAFVQRREQAGETDG